MHNQVQGWKRCGSMLYGLNLELEFQCSTGEADVVEYSIDLCQTLFTYSCETAEVIKVNQKTPHTNRFKKILSSSWLGFDVRLQFHHRCCKEGQSGNCDNWMKYYVSEDCYHCTDDSKHCKYYIHLANASVISGDFRRLN
uniref:Uncharacterized protein n=1 Tax=Parastrongyloides trichosuri TaxID=131310 RepID=A0A0N5A4M0_PARTI